MQLIRTAAAKLGNWQLKILLQHLLDGESPGPLLLPRHCSPLPLQECTLRSLHRCHRHSCGPRPVWRNRQPLCEGCSRLCTGSLASSVSPGILKVCLHQEVLEIRDPDLQCIEPQKAKVLIYTYFKSSDTVMRQCHGMHRHQSSAEGYSLPQSGDSSDRQDCLCGASGVQVAIFSFSMLSRTAAIRGVSSPAMP